MWILTNNPRKRPLWLIGFETSTNCPISAYTSVILCVQCIRDMCLRATTFSGAALALMLCRPMCYLRPRADPASKFRGAISVIFGSQVLWRVHYRKREEVYFKKYCCDKAMDGKMSWYRECCFLNCTKSWWIKLPS